MRITDFFGVVSQAEVSPVDDESTLSSLSPPQRDSPSDYRDNFTPIPASPGIKNALSQGHGKWSKAAQGARSWSAVLVLAGLVWFVNRRKVIEIGKGSSKVIAKGTGIGTKAGKSVANGKARAVVAT